MKKLLFLLPAFLLLFLFSSCSQDDEEIINDIVTFSNVTILAEQHGDVMYVDVNYIITGTPIHGATANIAIDGVYTTDPSSPVTTPGNKTAHWELSQDELPDGAEVFGKTFYNTTNDSVSSDPIIISWDEGTSSDIALGDAVHTPTDTGGISVINVSNVTTDQLATVVVKRISDNLILGNYSIDVPADAEDFSVVVDYTDSVIYYTEINLRVEIDGVVENYQYTTLPETTCGLTLTGSYTTGDANVVLTITGNDRAASFNFETTDSSGTVLNNYTRTVTGDNDSEEFTFPAENVNNEIVHFIVTSPQHDLCVLDNFSYTTPNKSIDITMTGVVAGTLTPSGGTFAFNYVNTNFTTGDVANVTVSTSSTGMMLIDDAGNYVSSFDVELPGSSGSKQIQFISSMDENSGSFTVNSSYMASAVTTNVTTLTQIYDASLNTDVTNILANQTSTVQFASVDVTANHAGTKVQTVTLKIKNTLAGHSPVEYLNLLVLDGINIPVSSAADWGSTDAEGFYTFVISSTSYINTSNVDFSTFGYRSNSFTAGGGDEIIIKVTMTTEFIEGSSGQQFNIETFEQTIPLE